MNRSLFLGLVMAIAMLGCSSSSEDPDSETDAKSVVEIELVGPGSISTDSNETFPAENPADGSLWFSVYDESFGEQTIMWIEKTTSGWGRAQVAPFSGWWSDRAPRFSPDGKTLYFTSNRPRSEFEEESETTLNIWQVQRSGDQWASPEPVDGLNSGANEIHAVVSEQAMWFASDREGSLGRSDIYRFTVDSGVEHLPAPLNDAHSQPDLWISADESWMILVITGHPEGYGGDDLYLSRRVGDTWSKPKNLGPEVNSEEYEYGPSVSLDGKYLYFTSHRDGSADIFRTSLSEVLEAG